MHLEPTRDGVEFVTLPYMKVLEASIYVSRLNIVILSLSIQVRFGKPRSQTTMLVGITSMACHSNIRVGQLIMNS